MTAPDDKYSREEMDAILGRALDQSGKESDKVDHETLVAAAGEVGIPRAAVEAAARDVRAPKSRSRSRRAWAIVAIVAATVSVLSIGIVVARRQWSGGALPSGVYVLRSSSGDTCLDGPGWTKALWTSQDGVLSGRTCSASGTQLWAMHAQTDGTYTVESTLGKKCLDVPRFSRDEGLPLQQWGCTGAPNQRWRIAPAADGSIAVVSVSTGKCASVDDKSRLVQSSCRDSPHQRWQAVAQPL